MPRQVVRVLVCFMSESVCVCTDLGHDALEFNFIRAGLMQIPRE